MNSSGRDGKLVVGERARHSRDEIASIRSSAEEPPLARLHRRLGRARRALRDGDLSAAAVAAEKLTRISASLVATTEELAIAGSAYVVLGRVADESGDRAGASWAFARGAELMHSARDYVWGSGEHVADLGHAEFAGGSPGAEESLRRAIELGWNTVDVRRQLGLHLLADGRLDEAKFLLDEVVDDEPSDWRAWGGLAAIAEAVAEVDEAGRLWIIAAERMTESGWVEEGLDAYRASDRLSPSLQAKRGVAKTLSQLGRFLEAENAANEVLTAEPDDYPMKVVRVEALLGAENFEAAAGNARELLEFDAEDAVAQAYLGMALYNLGDYAEAASTLRVAHDLMPLSSPIRRHLATTLVALDRRDEAVQILSAGLEQDPDDGELRAARAELHAAAGDLDAAAADVAAIADRDPTLAPWLWFSRELVDAGDYPRALDAADRALACAPDDPEVLNVRGVVLGNLGRLDDAIAALRQSLHAEPSTLAMQNLALALFKRNADRDVGEAEDLAREASEREPENPALATLLAEILYHAQRFGDGLVVLDSTASRCPRVRDVDYLRAEGLLQLERPREALDLIDAALELFAPDAGLELLRARAMVALDRLSEAADAAQQAAELDPHDVAVHSLLGRIHYDLSMIGDEPDGRHASAAIAALEHTIECDAEDIGSSALLGRLYATRNRLDEAEHLLVNALRLADRNGSGPDPDTLAELGRVHLLRGDREEALAAFAEALAVDDGHTVARVLEGEALYGLQRYSESVDALLRALGPDGDDPYILSQLGESYRMLGRLEESVQTLTVALQRAPLDNFSLTSRGAAYLQLGDLDAADADLRTALADTPRDLFALNRFVDVQLQLGRLDDALAAWRAALDVDPESIDLHVGYADALRMTDEPEDALPVIERVLRHEPSHVLALRVFGRTLQAVGRIDEAAIQFDRALSVEPDSVDAAVDLASALDALAKPWAALKTIRSAVQSTRSSPLLVDYGWRLVRLALLPEALGVARRANELDPDDPEPYKLLSWVLPMLGDHDGAVEAARTTVRLAPEDSWVHKQLGNVLWSSGRPDEAIPQWRWVADRADLITDDQAVELHILGWSLLCLGDHAGAALCLSKAVALGFDELSALFDLGVNSLAAGQVDEALDTFGEARSLIKRDMSPRRGGGAERALTHRGSIAVVLYDLRTGVDRGRLPPSKDLDRLVTEFGELLAQLPLPDD